jgi:hypothetical protein
MVAAKEEPAHGDAIAVVSGSGCFIAAALNRGDIDSNLLLGREHPVCKGGETVDGVKEALR